MDHVQSRYMRLIDRSDPHLKTKTIVLISKSSGFNLGEIRWYAPWRQYCFFPNGISVFNKGCLKEIICEIDLLMADHGR